MKDAIKCRKTDAFNQNFINGSNTQSQNFVPLGEKQMNYSNNG